MNVVKMDDVHETLIGIESELHNMNLNILELIKVIKGKSDPKIEKDVKCTTDNITETLFGCVFDGLENNNE